MSCCLVFACLAVGADPAAAAAARQYAAALAEATAHLDAGRLAAARAKLTGLPTDGFEFAYLQARLAAGTEAQPAPDLIRTAPAPKGVEVRYAALNPVSRRLAYGCRDGKVRVYDLAGGEPTELGDGTHGVVWSLAYSRDGKTLVVGHEDGTVGVWDAATGEARGGFATGTKWAVRELAVAPDGSAAVAEGQKELQLWSLAGAEPVKVAAVGERYTFGEGLAFSPVGDRLATGGMFDVLLFDAKTGLKQSDFRHASYTMGLEFSPDGKRVASAPRGNVNRFLSVFELDGTEVWRVGPLPAYTDGLAFTPDGKRLVATRTDRTVQLYDGTTGVVLLEWKRPANVAKPATAADGRLFGWNQPDGFRFIDLGPAPPGR